MGIIDYYAAVDHFKPVHPDIVLRPSKEVEQKAKPLLPDARQITLAQYDPTTKNTITAHRLKDYRRKTFRISLLPEIHLWLDDIMDGSVFWHDKLHNESPYS